MSVMHRGDEDLHYSDNSHRWIAPPDIDQAVWEAGMRAHMAQHRATMGGPFNIDELIEVPPPRVPGSASRAGGTRSTVPRRTGAAARGTGSAARNGAAARGTGSAARGGAAAPGGRRNAA